MCILSIYIHLDAAWEFGVIPELPGALGRLEGFRDFVHYMPACSQDGLVNWQKVCFVYIRLKLEDCSGGFAHTPGKWLTWAAAYRTDLLSNNTSYSLLHLG